MDFTEWLQLKPQMPNKQLPALKIDEEPLISQSAAIRTYLAKLAGIYPEDAFEAANVGMVVGHVQDLLEPMFKFCVKKHLEQDLGESNKMQASFYAERLPRGLSVLNRLLESREYFVENTLTLADLAVFDMVDYVELLKEDSKFALSDYEKLQDHYDRIAAIPTVSKHLQSRPETPF